MSWAVTSGTIPAGFFLNASTGAISGSLTVNHSFTVTITGTSANRPSQIVTKQITIISEPVVTLSSASNEIFIYNSNVRARPSTSLRFQDPPRLHGL
ncbi:MAG: Ig domain-containing protein [Candidatus Methanomethylophilaceae archaeon]